MANGKWQLAIGNFLKETESMKNLRAMLALGLVCLFVFGCKLDGNTNNRNNSNNSNNSSSSGNENESENGNKSSNSNKSGKTGQPDIGGKLPIPSKKQEEPVESGSSGQTISHKGAGISLTIPEGWNGKDGGDRYIVASPDGRMEIYFYVPADGNFDNGIRAISEEMNKYLQNLKVTESGKKGTINGMQTLSEFGEGTYDGTPVIWALTAFKSPKDPLFVITVADPEQYAKNKEGYQQLIGSIKPS
jgi:hypothetical protein